MNLEQKFEHIKESDTHLGDKIVLDISKRDNIVMDKLKEISKHELVITDRLHGMIFAYLTDTPCLVFDNNNHKISQTYDTWLKNNTNIILVKKMIGNFKLKLATYRKQCVTY
ncbi:polysaccharide pyruvyl transferase family protein [Aerococcus urinaeequi]|uniref:polysaccharide pyruvyl transferase family protein n=1 Tax=Aerococcus urinaeequi TaxID=51665 RepID=UPI003D6B0B28